ncbi:MAG: hypothetical protein K0R00_2999 [Herbinix sp.]|nr:hypothetical protein [Herbinix sp.]
MKARILVILLIIFTVVFTGCRRNNDDDNAAATKAPTTAVTKAPTTAPTTATTTAPTNAATQTPDDTDAVTTASIVNTEDAFLKAISKDGTWIIAILSDMSIDKELVLEGEFKNGKQDEAGKDVIQRKIALYTQDADRNITNRFTLTAPKLTVKSPKASIQHGKFKGDIYVDVADFQLIDTEVEGNVYFTKQEYMDSFKADETSKVSGKKELAK